MITSLETEEAAPGTTERRNGAPSLDGTALSPASASSAATDALWQAVLDDLERDPSISRASFATWLRSTRLLAVADGAFVVGAQHAFALQKLERSFRGPVEQALRRQTGNAAARVRFIVARAPGATRAPEATPRPLPLKTSGTDESRRTKDESGRSSFVFRPPSGADSTLNPGWTFETFAVDRQNQFAYAAACAVADNPSFAYNPLVLFGPPGAGKTHLLHAIGQRVVAVRAGARVRYLPARALAAEWLRCGADVATFAAYREQAARADVL